MVIHLDVDILHVLCCFILFVAFLLIYNINLPMKMILLTNFNITPSTSCFILDQCDGLMLPCLEPHIWKERIFLRVRISFGKIWYKICF